MTDDVTVCTPTIPGRELLLVECMACVSLQTDPPAGHRVYRDQAAAGPAVMRNLLLNATTTDWVAFLDDDDLIDAEHLEVLGDALVESGADLAFSWHRTVGAVPLVPRFDAWNGEAVAYMQSGINVVPVTVMARRSALLSAGGFYSHDRWEDYSLWMRMLAAGAQFVCVPVETWTYRMLGGNRTWQA